MILTDRAREQGWEVVLWKPPQDPFVCHLTRRILDGFLVHAVLWSLGGLKLNEWEASGVSEAASDG